jgi:hypothetical protein
MNRFTQYPLIILLFLSNSLHNPVPPVSEDLVDWSSHRKLSWNDYHAKPDPYSDAAASTTTIVGVEYTIGRNSFTYHLNCRFSRDRSWGLYKTDYILSHEQGHFDIAEIYARELNRQLSTYQFNSRTYDADLKKIYDRVMADKAAMQNRYDRETNHSIKRDEQRAWLKKIQQMLDETEPWSDY